MARQLKIGTKRERKRQRELVACFLEQVEYNQERAGGLFFGTSGVQSRESWWLVFWNKWSTINLFFEGGDAQWGGLHFSISSYNYVEELAHL
jgi:hypothetical protein